MKPLYFLLFLLALMLGCDKKFDYDYAVVCEFSPLFGEKNWLIVTAEDGTVLKEIEVAEGASSVSEKFALSQQEPNELLNLHLVKDNPNDLWRSMSIVSHYGVKNGQPVSLHDRYGFVSAPPSQKEVKVMLKDIATDDWVKLPGCAYRYVSFWPNPVIAISLLSGQGAMIQTTTPPNIRQIYLPSGTMTDSIVVSIDQFDKTHKKLGIQLPTTDGQSDTATLWLGIQAVSLDLQQHVSLGEQGGKCGEILYFDLPNGLDPNWAFHISCFGEKYLFGKAYSLSDPIHLNGPSIDITSTTAVSGQEISVKCSGPVDWLSAASQSSTPAHYLHWTVMGSPSAFQNLKLPTADQLHLPIGVEIFKTYTVRAFSAPEYGYDGITAGLPWKSSDPFAASLKGYEMVQKRHLK